MIPSVFISSTIADLNHLREALKDTVQELSYRPVLSEFGDIGYLPQISAEDSCYLTMRDCQIAILIVSKRYGALSSNGRGITHNEFLVARENTIPVVCLVDREVLSYKKVFDAAGDGQKELSFPGMDLPGKTFSLLQDIMHAPVNNGILAYSSVADARTLLKTQLAHLFGELLRLRFDPVKAGINDVLSEIMTLRQELKNKEMDPQPFLRAIRFLLNDSKRAFREFVENISGSIESAVPLLLKCKTFENYLAETGTEIIPMGHFKNIDDLEKSDELVVLNCFVLPHSNSEAANKSEAIGTWFILRGKRAAMDDEARRFLFYTHESLRRAAGV